MVLVWGIEWIVLCGWLIKGESSRGEEGDKHSLTGNTAAQVGL